MKGKDDGSHFWQSLTAIEHGAQIYIIATVVHIPTEYN